MAAIDTLKLRNSTGTANLEVDVNDIRIYTSETTTPDDSSYDGHNDFSGGIFLQPNGGVTTSDGWKYFIDSMGICTCWKTFTGNFTPPGSWNHVAVYDGFLSGSERNFPVTFAEKPSISIFINSAYAWIYTSYQSSGGYDLSTTQAPMISVATLGTSASGWGSRGYRLDIVATGRIAK